MCVCVCETGRRTKRTEARLFVFVVVVGALWAVACGRGVVVGVCSMAWIGYVEMSVM